MHLILFLQLCFWRWCSFHSSSKTGMLTVLICSLIDRFNLLCWIRKMSCDMLASPRIEQCSSFTPSLLPAQSVLFLSSDKNFCQLILCICECFLSYLKNSFISEAAIEAPICMFMMRELFLGEFIISWGLTWQENLKMYDVYHDLFLSFLKK